MGTEPPYWSRELLKSCFHGASCGLTIGLVIVAAACVKTTGDSVPPETPPPVNDILRARRIEVVDQSNRIRGLLQVTRYGTVQLELFTEATAPSTPIVLPAESASAGQVSLSVNDDFGGRVAVTAPPNSNEFVAGLTTSLHPGTIDISTRPADPRRPAANTRFVVNTFNTAHPHITLNDQHGTTIWRTR